MCRQFRSQAVQLFWEHFKNAIHFCGFKLQAWYSGWLVMGLPYNVSHSKLPGVAAHSTSCHLARRFLCRSRLFMLNILNGSWVRHVYRIWFQRCLIKIQDVSREIKKVRIDHRCTKLCARRWHDTHHIMTFLIQTWFFAFPCISLPVPIPRFLCQSSGSGNAERPHTETTNWLSELDESLGGCEWLAS